MRAFFCLLLCPAVRRSLHPPGLSSNEILEGCFLDLTVTSSDSDVQCLQIFLSPLVTMFAVSIKTLNNFRFYFSHISGHRPARTASVQSHIQGDRRRYVFTRTSRSFHRKFQVQIHGLPGTAKPALPKKSNKTWVRRHWRARPRRVIKT